MVDFLAKRVALLVAVLVTAVFIARGWDLFAVAGIVSGAAFAVYKVVLNKRNLVSMCALGRSSAPFFLIASQAAGFAFLLISILIDTRLFIGVTAGFLLMPAVICLNGITEKIGLTRNGWGEEGGTDG